MRTSVLIYLYIKNNLYLFITWTSCCLYIFMAWTLQDDSGLGHSDISRSGFGSQDYSGRYRDYSERSRNFSGLPDYQDRSRMDQPETGLDYRTTGVDYSSPLDFSKTPRDYSGRGNSVLPQEEDNISGQRLYIVDRYIKTDVFIYNIQIYQYWCSHLVRDYI